MDTFIVTFFDIAANGILVWCLEWCCNTAYFHSGVANGCLRIAMQHMEHNTLCIYNISADATCNYFVCDFHTQNWCQRTKTQLNINANVSLSLVHRCACAFNEMSSEMYTNLVHRNSCCFRDEVELIKIIFGYISSLNKHLNGWLWISIVLITNNYPLRMC